MIQFRCGCGAVNYNWQDWIAHFKYGQFVRGIRHLMNTRIEFTGH
jgi:hypothetical protein